jgi:LytS/YehU family sensor histidine kinase
MYATIAGYDMPNSGTVVSIRDAGAMVAGFAGEPIGGLVAGVIAGLHRLLLGLPDVTAGTSIPCAISTVLIGVITGFLEKFYKSKKHQPLWALLHGALMEALHLSIAFFYLWMMKGSAEIAFNALKEIAIPFILSNSIAFGLIVLLQNQIRKLRKMKIIPVKWKRTWCSYAYSRFHAP